MPGMRQKNMYMASDGSLKIEGPETGDSGHYVCSALNSVGSALARSQLIVRKGHLAPTGDEENGSSAADIETEEVRLALLERVLEEVEVKPIGSTSIKVGWLLSATSPGQVEVLEHSSI